MANRAEAAADRRHRALQLRKAGATYDQIAQQVGYTNRGSAYRAVAEALREAKLDTAGDAQQLEVQRLDQMLMALWPKAMQGSGWAVDRILRMMELRANDLATPERRSTVVEGVQRDLDGLPEELRGGALAATALELARAVDLGLNQASCAKELRGVMAELTAKAPAKAEGDTVDELAEQRNARRKAASAG